MPGPSPRSNVPPASPQLDDDPRSNSGGMSFADSTPLIGREGELRRLRNRLRLAEAGTAGLMAIGGDPGVGKTRLARHLAAEARAGPFTVVWASSLEDDWQPHYQVWDDILSQLVVALDWHPTPDRAPHWMAPLIPIVSALADAYPGSKPLGSLTTPEEQFRVADAIVRCIYELAQRTPILIVIDDIQWVDAESVRVLRNLATFPDTAHFLILFTVRADSIERFPAIAELASVVRREAMFEEVRLGGLTQDQVGALMRTVADEALPEQVVHLIADGTRGNPLFVQEMTQHYLESRRTQSVENLIAQAEAGEYSVPDTLRQMVEHRLSRLSERAQRTLRLASVCTHGFDFAMLRVLTSMDENDLLDALDEALASRLIMPVEPGPERYGFRHGLVRRALYNTWSPSRRARLNRMLAESLVALYGPTAYLHAGQIASHYHISAKVPGAEAGVPFAIMAAETASQRLAPDQAAGYYRMALEMAAALPADERASITRRLTLAEADAFAHGAALAGIDDALRLMDEAGSSAGEKARFLAEAITALHDGGAATDLWTPLLYQGLALVDPDDEITWARLTLLIERFEPMTVGIINGSKWLGSDQRAVEIARNSGDELLFARSLQPWDLWDREWTEHLSTQIATWHQPTAIIRALTVCGADWLYHHGDFRRARSHFEKLLLISERQASIPGQAEALLRLGITHVALGNFVEARDCEARSSALVEHLGPSHRLHASIRWLQALLIEIDRGDWSEVGAYFIAYVADPMVGQTTIAFDDAALAAYALTRMGDAGEARQLLVPLVRILDQLDPSLWLLNGTVAFAAAAVWELRDREFAAPIYDCAIDIIYAGHDDYPCCSNYLSVARMAILLGRPDEARMYLDMARSHLEESGQRPLRAMVDLDEAAMMAMPGQDDLIAARRLAEKAAAQFAHLGMTAWHAEAKERAAGYEQQAKGPASAPGGLTQRELDVVRLLARGFSDRQISDDLYLSLRTVHAHVRNILGKTELKNRTELSVWAVDQGIVGTS